MSTILIEVVETENKRNFNAEFCFFFPCSFPFFFETSSWINIQLNCQRVYVSFGVFVWFTSLINDQRMHIMLQTSCWEDLSKDGLSLPVPMADIAISYNPSNKDEILLMGGFLNSTIYIYNNKTDEFKQIFPGFEQLYQGTKLSGALVVSGPTPDTVLLMGKFYGTKTGFYAVFDTKKLIFKPILKRQLGNCSSSIEKRLLNNHLRSNYCLFDNKKRNLFNLHTGGAKLNRFKNYLIASGSYHFKNKISIFEIDCDTLLPKLIKVIELYDVKMVSFEYVFHGAVIIKSNYISNCIELLLFGGRRQYFETSFCKVGIDFEILKGSIKNGVNNMGRRNSDDDTINKNNHVSGLDEQFSDAHKITAIDKTDDAENKGDYDGISIEFNPRHWVGDFSKIKQLDIFRCAFKLYYFTYHWIDNRYLIVIGGRTIDTISKEIIYFDNKYGKWNHLPFTLPYEIFGHASIICNKYNKVNNDKFKNVDTCTSTSDDNAGKILRIMGGCDKMSSNNATLNVHWKLNITRNFAWKFERIIWIAFYKNEFDSKHKHLDDMNDGYCYFGIMPKDVVLSILLFLRNQSIFDQESNDQTVIKFTAGTFTNFYAK